MRMGFVGNGAVASAFGQYLAQRGVTVSGGFDRHADKKQRFARLTGARACEDAGQVAAISDIVLLTTRDDQIEGACQALCEQGAVEARHLVGHMSGAHASTILAAAARRGAAVFSLHPLQAFADTQTALAALSTTCFSLEGADDRLETLDRLMGKLGNTCFHLAPEQKSLYHLAACIMSNYLVALMDAGLEAFAAIGIEPGKGFGAMRPLIEGTLSNIERLGTARALTGPIARGDLGTIEQHLNAMQKRDLDDLRSFYAFFGMRTVALAARAGLSDERRRQFRRLLAPAEPSRCHGTGE